VLTSRELDSQASQTGGERLDLIHLDTQMKREAAAAETVFGSFIVTIITRISGARGSGIQMW